MTPTLCPFTHRCVLLHSNSIWFALVPLVCPRLRWLCLAHTPAEPETSLFLHWHLMFSAASQSWIILWLCVLLWTRHLPWSSRFRALYEHDQPLAWFSQQGLAEIPLDVSCSWECGFESHSFSEPLPSSQLLPESGSFFLQWPKCFFPVDE